MGTNKKRYLTYLAWFGFVLAFLMLARYLYFHVEAELDADLASDLVFAEYVSEEKNPVPTGWCYSTDLRVLNTQLIFAPLFYLIQNCHMIRVVGTLLCLAIMIGSYAWLAYNLEVSYFPVMAVLFLCPLSKEYIYVVLCGAAYTPHITISFLTVGTFLYLWKHSIREKKNRIILLFLELLSFGAGLAGYRQLLVCYIPFMITVGLFWMFSPKNKEYLKLVMLAMSALICAMVGNFVNTRWCMTKYNVTNYSLIHLKDFSFDRFEMVINGWLSNLGYKSDVDLFSAEGLFGNAFFAIIFLTVGAAILSAWKRQKQYYKKQMLVMVYFLCMAVVFLMLYLFTDVYYESRYLLPVTIWIVPVIAILFQNENKKICTVLAGILMVFCLITAFSYYNRPIINPNEEYENMAQILQENNMHEGYATFWHANLLTEISNGSEEVWHCEIQNDQFMIQNVRPWLQKKEHGLRTPEGKCFILLSKEECDELAFTKKQKKSHVLYQSDQFVLYGFADYEELAEYISQPLR